MDRMNTTNSLPWIYFILAKNYSEVEYFLLGLLIFVILIALVENFSVLLAFMRIRSSFSSNKTNLFLVALTIADLFSTGFKRVLSVSVYIGFGGKLLCFLYPFTAIPPTMSCWLMFLIAFDRYMIIVHPLRKKLSLSLVIILIAMSFIMSLILTGPVLYFLKISKEPVNKETIEICREVWPSLKVELLFAVLVFLIQFFFPLLFTIILYLHIGCSIHKRNKLKKSTASSFQGTSTNIPQTNSCNINNNLNNNNNAKDDMQMIPPNNTSISNTTGTMQSTKQRMVRRSLRTNRILFSIVLCYIICWTPQTLLRLYMNLKFPITSPELQPNKNYIMDMFFDILSTVSACMNPIFYGWLNESVKNSIKRNFSLVKRFFLHIICCQGVCCRNTNSQHDSSRKNADELSSQRRQNNQNAKQDFCKYYSSNSIDYIDKMSQDFYEEDAELNETAPRGNDSESLNDSNKINPKKSQDLDLMDMDDNYAKQSLSLSKDRLLFKARAFDPKFYKHPSISDELSFSRNTSLVTFSTNIQKD